MSKLTERFFFPGVCSSHLICLRQNLTIQMQWGVGALREASLKDWGWRPSPTIYWRIICPSLLSGAAGDCPVFTYSLVQRIVHSFHQVIVAW